MIISNKFLIKSFNNLSQFISVECSNLSLFFRLGKKNNFLQVKRKAMYDESYHIQLHWISCGVIQSDERQKLFLNIVKNLKLNWVNMWQVDRN